MKTMRTHTLKINKETRDLLDGLLWVLGDSTNIKSSVSNESILIFNNKAEVVINFDWGA